MYSEAGRGTTFKLLFPVSDMAGQAVDDDRPASAKRKPDMSGAGNTVLVVDDDETVPAMSKMFLEELGYMVLTAEDGLVGVETYRMYSEVVDVVLLDLTMPHMDGDEAFRQIRIINGEVPVIMTSGYNEQDAISRFAGRNIAGFI